MSDRPLDVLVVDDELLIRWAISRTLAAAGHHVREASDGASAIAALESGDPLPDAVLLDYRLPDTRGLDLLAAVRRLSPASTVVMMSADASACTAEALALGASSVMQKPFDMEDLEPALAGAVRAH
jgi:DNA-binding NtrC family response regulator